MKQFQQGKVTMPTNNYFALLVSYNIILLIVFYMTKQVNEFEDLMIP